MDSRDTARASVPKILSIVATMLLASQGAAVEMAFVERTGQTDDLHTCGVRITASHWVQAALGLAVAGGYSSDLVDGSEWLDFDLDEPQIGVYLVVNTAEDLDFDGVAGRAIVEAFDAVGSSLGARMIQEAGVKDLALLFGPTTISRVRLTALGDGLRLATFGYEETGAVEMDLLNGGLVNSSTAEPTLCGVRFSGSGAVYYRDAEFGDGGLGVGGGGASTYLDGSEWMRLEFPYPVDELVLESLLESLDGDFLYGEAVLFAYDASGLAVGSMSLARHSLFGGPLTQSVDVASRLGVGGIAEIEIYSLGDARRLDRVIYAPEPSIGAGAALLALAALARRRSRRAVIRP